MEQIAHAVDEYASWLPPVQRVFQHVGLQRDLETISVIGLPHGLEAMCQPFGIAELAAGANLGAAGNRVPCCVSPFDVGNCWPFASETLLLAMFSKNLSDNLLASWIGGGEEEIVDCKP